MELQQLKDRYAKYLEEVARVYAGAKPMDGLFGWGDDPRKDPCHMRFYEDIEAGIQAFAAASRSPEELFEAVRFMITLPAEHKEEPGFWFLYAAHGLTRGLIPRLTAAQCAGLRDFYDDNYPKRDRMPVQQEVYKLLKKGAKK